MSDHVTLGTQPEGRSLSDQPPMKDLGSPQNPMRFKPLAPVSYKTRICRCPITSPTTQRREVMMWRRLCVVSGLVASLTACGSSGVDGLCNLCVSTDAGTVKGVREGEVLAFKSIPYAAAPTGALRFRPPQPTPAWQGVRDATFFREACPQVRDALEVYPHPGTPITNPLTGASIETFENEDCLHVNVWTPKVGGDKKRPVMVFIPGGAFEVGNGSNDFYSGQHLAARDVVVVTINYRVGLFGFMELGSLDPSYAGSGNNGLRDQIAALQWVRRNAAAFGGDPDNITVFGESAGSISISALLATKSPERLFRRAILQSGASNQLHAPQFANATASIISQWGPKKTVQDLLTASVRELLEQQDNTIQNVQGGDALFAPYIDNALILGDPYDLVSAGNAANVDLLLGANQDEMGYWSMYDSQFRNLFVENTDSGPPVTVIPKSVRDAVDAKLAPASLDAVYAEWMRINDTPIGQRSSSQTAELLQDHDFVMIQPMTRLAEKQAAHNVNTWLYRFQWKVPAAALPVGAPDLGAVHALELPFVFGTLDFAGVPVPGANAALSDQFQKQQMLSLAEGMMTAWTSFARTGNPNAAGVPAWLPYNATTRPTLLWRNNAAGNISSESADDPDAERRRAWTSWPFPSFPWDPSVIP
ncbi:carboxylesterase/lipase family protein [Burkholderia cepacia]|uniref:carboxylesterase/lipase family protein n=1 Tax=Burkholderia cepacia TaxID=292 RepID=UPI003EE322D5